MLLLGQVLVLFVAGPLLSAHVLNFAVMDGMQILLLVIAALALPPHSKVRILILLCVAGMVWMLCAGPNPHLGLMLHTVATLSITVAVGQSVFRAQWVTRHQLLGAVVVYLNLALLFVGAYDSISLAFPGAFTTLNKASSQSGELVYFSLTTLTSTGYGDILPVHPLARSFANLEAVCGQLFLAILLARLVSLHSGSPGSSTDNNYQRG
ncbi:potassium channel family protein [Hymenobacter sp. BT730]|uniref:potassium channel family protein n=1 Tax=Hymenobacter sp. BT730 TaxID=3063332 RepID=UPI0026DFE762|nr:potassium channel family protein [Hymenobacter sp. BT730]